MASKRGYVTKEEVDELTGVAGTTDLQVSEAEEIIDDFVGPQEKFIEYDIRGLISAGGANAVRLQSDQQNNMQADYLRGCWMEIMGGTGEGQRRKITGQTLAGVITTESAWTTPLDTTSFYRIWQLGKFPRKCDVTFDGLYTQKYFKTISEKVRRAVAAQVEYMINEGKEFFGSTQIDVTSESIGDYSYSTGGRNSSNAGADLRLLSPKAKLLLKGIWNRTGSII